MQMANGLHEAGHEVCLTTAGPEGSLERLVADGVAVRHLHAERRKGWRAAVRLASGPARLAAAVETFRPDVVYSALYLGNATAHRAMRGTGIPLAWGFRCEVRPLGWKMRIPFEYCRRNSPSVPLAISNSRAGKESHEAAGFRCPQFLVVPNGIDVAAFRPRPEDGARVRAEWGVGDDERLVGIVGRLTATKDHPTFLRAAARFRSTHARSRFVCVGEGSPDYSAELRELADAEGLGDSLTWAGTRDDMPAVYCALDLVASTSTAEGFPNVLGEAMACRTPCVVTGVGDAADVVGGTGEVVAPGDVDAQVEAWKRVLGTTTADRAARGEAARARIVEEFSVARCASATADALRTLVDPSPPIAAAPAPEG